MDQNLYEYLIQGILFALGIVATWYFAKLYFKKSKTITEITTRLHHSSSTIRIEQSVEEDLEITYKGRPIKYLHHFQFVIKNSGNVAIAEIIDPLRLKLPEYYDFINIELAHVHPDGREILYDYQEKENQIEFEIKVFNSQEYFIFNLLLSVSNENAEKVKIADPDFKFLITAKDLPPVLVTKFVSLNNYIEAGLVETLKPLSWVILKLMAWFMAFVNLGGVIMFALLTLISLDNEKHNILNYNTFLTNFNVWSIVIILGWLLAVPLLAFSLIAFIELFRKKKKIIETFEDSLEKLPSNILKKW